jgi:hypothetical protein
MLTDSAPGRILKSQGSVPAFTRSGTEIAGFGTITTGPLIPNEPAMIDADSSVRVGPSDCAASPCPDRRTGDGRHPHRYFIRISKAAVSKKIVSAANLPSLIFHTSNTSPLALLPFGKA